MKFLKKCWHNLLVFLKIRKVPLFRSEKAVLQEVKTYQQASLALLQNLMCHVSTANMRFKAFDNLDADLSDGTVKFRNKKES